jgi:hypothetical protein
MPICLVLEAVIRVIGQACFPRERITFRNPRRSGPSRDPVPARYRYMVGRIACSHASVRSLQEVVFPLACTRFSREKFLAAFVCRGLNRGWYLHLSSVTEPLAGRFFQKYTRDMRRPGGPPEGPGGGRARGIFTGGGVHRLWGCGGRQPPHHESGSAILPAPGLRRPLKDPGPALPPKERFIYQV